MAKAIKWEKIGVQMEQVDGSRKNIVLQLDKFRIMARVNLLSFTGLLSQEAILAKDMKNDIVALINGNKIFMERRIRT